MPPTFPKRRFRTGEIIAPDILTETFQDPVMKLAGHLNEHDFEASDLKTKFTVAAGAYYAGHHIMWETDPNLTRGGGVYYADLDGLGDATATISDTDGWQPVEDDDTGTDLSRTMTCGEDDILCVFAQLQHFAWSGDGSADTAADIDSPLRLQYAIQVDGVVLDNTITGAAVYPDPVPQQWYRATAAVSTADFDYRHIQYVQGTLGVNQAAHPTRLIYTAPVSSGSHTVAVVARRVPPAEYKVDNDGDGATVQVFNRRLFVLRIKGMSPHSGEAPTVTVDAFEDGQVLDATDITGAFSTLSSTANDLTNANVERGAFRNDHLPSIIYGQKSKVITPASATAAITGEYPGYGTQDAAWTVVTNAGDDLEITGPTAGEWRFDTFPSTFVVLANVQVNKIVWTGASSPSTSIEAIGCFAIRITNSAGTVTVLGETEVYTNGHAFDNNATANAMVGEDDVPLMWVVDSADLSAANQRITKIEVVACVWDGAAGTSPPDVEMKTQRGSLFAFGLKGVTL